MLKMDSERKTKWDRKLNEKIREMALQLLIKRKIGKTTRITRIYNKKEEYTK